MYNNDNLTIDYIRKVLLLLVRSPTDWTSMKEHIDRDKSVESFLQTLFRLFSSTNRDHDYALFSSFYEWIITIYKSKKTFKICDAVELCLEMEKNECTNRFLNLITFKECVCGSKLRHRFYNV